jgi:hypothetical protein
MRRLDTFGRQPVGAIQILLGLTTRSSHGSRSKSTRVYSFDTLLWREPSKEILRRKKGSWLDKQESKVTCTFTKNSMGPWNSFLDSLIRVLSHSQLSELAWHASWLGYLQFWQLKRHGRRCLDLSDFRCALFEQLVCEQRLVLCESFFTMRGFDR